MQTYIGTKIINATPMTRQEYNDFRGWKLPEDENGEDTGYLVEYVDGGPANTPHYPGYVSWSPTEVFDKSYRATSGLSFGLAIEAAKMGKRIARTGWNGKDMWVVYMSPMSLPPFNTQGTDRKVNDRTARWIGEDTPLNTRGYFAMWTANKEWQPGWTPSTSDVLADDWQIVD